MEAFLKAIKALRLWQVVVLMTVLLGSAGVTYGLYATSTSADVVNLSANEQVIPVQYGNLTNQVSTNGTLTFPERKSLSFGTGGTVAAVPVKEGQLVSVGATLARLESSIVTSLEKNVAQARVDLKQAEETLEDVLQFYTPLELAQAEEVVSNARFQVQEARDALETARAPYTDQEINAQLEMVSNARFQVQEAQDALKIARTPYTDQEIKTQVQMVSNARQGLKQAQEDLADLSPANTLRFAQARQAKADAEVALEAAQDALIEHNEIHTRDLTAAIQARADAQIAYDAAQAALDDFLEDNIDTVSERRDALARASSAYDQAVRELEAFKELEESGTQGIEYAIWRREQSVAARLEEVEELVSALAEADRIEAAVEVARDELIAAKKTLQELQQGPASLDIQGLEAAVAVAQADLRVAKDASTSVTNEVDPLELAVKESNLALAEATLAQAEEDLAELLAGADPLEVDLRERQVILAEATLAQAEEDLAELLAGADPLEVALREREVILAEATLAQAEEDLAELLAGADPLEVELGRAEIVSAESALAEARRLLQNSTLVAPFAGMIAAVNVEEGDEVQSNAVVLEIVDPRVLEINGIVDEIDVLLVDVGTTAQVTLDAVPGETFTGVVSEIASAGQNQQGVVTYPIRIQVELPTGVRAREGLTAIANIVLEEERNVLLVPQQALYGSVLEPVVRVKTSRGIEEKAVVLGNGDDFWVAVRSGLAEGDQVVMESAAADTSQSSFRDLRRATGGGFGGRGR